MILRCATCSNVTVWTQVCMAPMTQSHIWLRTWQTKGHTAREQLHTAVQQPPPGTASINTWLTYTLKCRVKVRYCCRVLAAEDYHQLSLSYPIDSTRHDISSSVTSFCRTPVFSLWFANCRQTQQDGQITEHASLAQSELRWTTGSAIEWLDCRL